MTAQAAVRALLAAHDLPAPRWAANEWLGALGDVSTVAAALAGGWRSSAVASRDAGWWAAIIGEPGRTLFGYRVRWWDGRDLLSLGTASTEADPRPLLDLVRWVNDGAPRPISTLVDEFDNAQLALVQARTRV